MGYGPEYQKFGAFDPTTIGMTQGAPSGLAAFLARPGLRDALLAAGSSLLSQRDQPGSLGSALGRALPVGMQAYQQGQQQSQADSLIAQMPPQMQAMLKMLPPGEQAQALFSLMQPKTPVSVAPGASLVDPVTGQVRYAAPSAPVAVRPGGSLVDPTTGQVTFKSPDKPVELPEEVRTAMYFAGLNPDTATPAEKNAALTRYEAIKNPQKPEPDGGFSLAPGENRYDKKGNLIVAGPPKMASSATTANMKDLASAAASANNQLGQLDVNLTHILPEAVSRESAKPGVISGIIAAGGRAKMTNEEQVAQAAGLGFIEPAIRYLAGGRLTDARLKLYAGSLLPQPGEGNAVIQAKRDRRAALLQAMSSGALIGQPNPDGTPNEDNVAKVIADLESRYNATSGKGSPASGGFTPTGNADADAAAALKAMGR